MMISPLPSKLAVQGERWGWQHEEMKGQAANPTQNGRFGGTRQQQKAQNCLQRVGRAALVTVAFGVAVIQYAPPGIVEVAVEPMSA